MIVQCPKCKTTFKVSDDLLKDSVPVFRCSRCKHTFDLGLQEEAQEPPVVPPPESNEAKELSFTFPPKEQAEAITTEVQPTPVPTQDFAPLGVERENFDLTATGGNEQKSAEPPMPFEIIEDPVPEKKPPEVFDPLSQPAPVAPGTESTRTFSDGGENILRIGSYQDQPVSTKPYLTLFGFLVAIFALVAAFNQAHPQATEGWVRQIPLIGTSVLKNNRLKDGVLIQSLRASYQSIQGNREVFVITGTALNQNPVTIRAVQISGQVFNDQNGEIEKQMVWVGNALSPNIVRGLSTQEVANLQKLPPLKTFEIPPGDSAPFTIVFLKTPKGAKDFVCKVVAAEGDA